MKIKIYDCFLFNNELDILELKLAEQWDGVDYFVIAEANRTFKGEPKPFHLLDNWQRFEPYHRKIRRIEITHTADLDPWVNETKDREELKRGLYDADSEDVIICSDTDEILRQSAIATMRKLSSVDRFDLRMPQFYYRLNYIMKQWKTEDNVTVCWLSTGQAVRFRLLNGIEQQRQDRLDLSKDKTVIVWHAGWHFSFQGDNSFVNQKMSTFDYTWLGKIKTNSIDIDKEIENLSWHGQDNYTQFEICRVNDYMPRVIRLWPDKWKHLTIPGDDYKDVRNILDPKLVSIENKGTMVKPGTPAPSATLKSVD